MHIKSLERATMALGKLKELDKKVVELERLGIMIAEGDTEINFNLNVIDLIEKQKTANSKLLTGHQSYIEAAYELATNPWRLGGSKAEPTPGLHAYTERIADTVALHLIHVLVWGLNCERAALLTELQKEGVRI